MNSKLFQFCKCFSIGQLFGVTFFIVFCTTASAATSDCKNPTEVSLNNTVKMKFCEIPAGSAWIGNDSGKSDEKPVTKRVFKSFQMGQYTVTQSQYKAVLGDDPWMQNDKPKVFVQESDNNPAVYVSYIQARQFVRMMNVIDSTAKYRLPTEAEFEYAARSLSTTEYYWGDDFDPSYVYYLAKGNSPQHARSVLNCPVFSVEKNHPGYCANSFGLMHMLGNVWQWTEDVYVANYDHAPNDGNVAVTGVIGSNRVVRGGAWNSDAYSMRSSSRFFSSIGGQSHNVGFRIVRTPK